MTGALSYSGEDVVRVRLSLWTALLSEMAPGVLPADMPPKRESKKEKFRSGLEELSKC
jgi:hypothetical protein